MSPAATNRHAPVLPPSFGPYAVRSLLGRGGTGLVYHALDPRSNEPVAIKTPLDARTSSRAALEREIAALARLTERGRKGIARLLDAGITDGSPWYAMEFVEGESLRAYVERLWGSLDDGEPASATRTRTAATRVDVTEPSGALPDPTPSRGRAGRRSIGAEQLDAALDLGMSIAEVLDGMHGDGVVHGDLTPDNVLIDGGGNPLLIDFGTAFQLYQANLSREIAQLSSRGVGTPGYMAPEQIRGEELDPRADLYALGCLFYELLTGSRPFEASSIDGLLRQHLSVAPPSLRDLVDGLNPALDRIVRSLLAKEPERRPSRAGDVLAALGQAARRSHTVPLEPALARTPSLYRPRLAGRSELLDALRALIDGVRDGSGCFVAMGGPSGSGKTRLLNELHALGAGAGFRVVSLTCDDGGADKPSSATSGGLAAFAPFLSRAAERLAAGEGEGGAAQEALGVLAGYFRPTDHPKLVAVKPRNVPSPADVFGSLEVLLLHFAVDAPLLLTIDDLHGADELTLRFLQERASSLSSARLLVVGTYRTDETSDRLAPVLEAARRNFELGALELTHVYALTKDLLATGTAPDGLPEFLAERSEGNPFLVAEHLRAAIARGWVTRSTDGRWSFRLPTAAGAEPPASVRELFSIRIERLSAAARSMLELAAVLGREFDATELSSLTDDLLLRGGVALEELISAQILEYVGPGRFRFVSDQLREAQRLMLSVEARRELHRLAAVALEATAESSLSTGERDARLGVHWHEAGDDAAALPYLKKAAHAFHASYAHSRATRLYRVALAACEKLGVEPAAVAELEEDLGDALLAQARCAEARAAFESALGRLGPADRLARARCHRKIASSFWRLQLAEDARAHLENAAAALGKPAEGDAHEVHRELIELELGRFERLYFARDTSSTAQDLLASLAGTIDLHGSPGQRVRYYLCASSDAMARSRYAFSELAVTLAEKGLAVPSELLTAHEEALSHFIAGFALMLGDLPSRTRALEQFELAEAGASRAGDRTLASRVALYQTITCLRNGDVRRTAKASRHASEVAETARIPPYVAAARACTAWVHWRDGDSVAARREAEAALHTWRAHPVNYPFRWCANIVLLGLALEQEDRDGMATAAMELTDPMQQALPPELHAALAATGGAVDTAAAVSTATLALRLARELGYG